MRMNPNNQAALMGQQMNYPTRMMAGGMNGVHPGQEGTGSPGDMAHKAGQQGPLQRSVLQKMAAAGR